MKEGRVRTRMWSAGNKGFSLIELAVVLVLMSLSIALIAPSLSRFSKSVELKASAQKIGAILRNYRSEAVNKGRVYQVLFDSNRMEVRVLSVVRDDEKDESENKEARETKTYSLPPGVQIKEIETESAQYPADLPAIEFYPNGGSNGGNIHLDARDHQGYRIKVHFLTGSVTIEKV